MLNIRVGKKGIYSVLSFLCAIAVFYLTHVFQGMAYWGEGLTWYVIGVIFTYLVWLTGIVLIFFSLRKQNYQEESFLQIIIGLITLLLLAVGFLWTTFVIIAGMSGM